MLSSGKGVPADCLVAATGDAETGVDSLARLSMATCGDTYCTCTGVCISA